MSQLYDSVWVDTTRRKPNTKEKQERRVGGRIRSEVIVVGRLRTRVRGSSRREGLVMRDTRI